MQTIVLDICSHPTVEQAQYACKIMHEHKCKILFTINEWGLDAEGVIHDFLLRNSIIHLNWCVDDPFYEELMHKKKFSPYSFRIDFVSDKDYLSEMNSKGYHAHFLPLATDPSIFFPDTQSQINDIAFVGNSYLVQTDKFCSKVPAFIENMTPTIASILKELLQNNEINLEEMLQNKISDSILPQDCSYNKALFICRQLISYLYRKEIILNLAKAFDNFIVFGDNGWHSYIGDKLHKPVKYYNGLKKVYNGTKINIDINRAVIRNGFTQRIFDVLACKSFLITSAKPLIGEFFETGENKREIVTFGTAEELIDLIRYFLKHETQLKSIAQRGYEKVLAAHTYKHRIQQIFKIVKKHLCAYMQPKLS